MAAWTVEKLSQYGDLAWNAGLIDGGASMVLNGKAYQAKGSGEVPEVVEVLPDMTYLYAAVVPHHGGSSALEMDDSGAGKAN